MTSARRMSWSLGFLFLAIIVAVGLGVGIVRMINGLGTTTGLTDSYPWGLWILYDIFFVPFSAGAFMILAITHIYGKHEYHAIARPVVVAGFLGEIMVIVVLVMDLGRWDHFYNVLFPWFWNLNSFMFQVSICLTVYMAVMVLEVAPTILEKLKWTRPLKWISMATVLIAGVGILLSCLHQSALGSLFLLMPYRLHALWWTPMLPLLFFTSAVITGLSMAILVVAASFKAFRRPLDLSLLSSLARAVAVLLGVYLVLKVGDLLIHGEIGLLFTSGWLSVLFLVELLVGVVLPMVLFSIRRVRETSRGLILGTTCVLAGVALNRTNVALLGFSAPTGGAYHPSWMEILIAGAAIAGGILLFVLAVRFLPILPKGEGGEDRVTPGWSRRVAVFVTCALALLTITVVLLLQPMTQAQGATNQPEAAATTEGQPRRGQCQACHKDEGTLAEAGAADATMGHLLIEPLHAGAVHANIQCVTCHFGDDTATETASAHTGVIVDPTGGESMVCVACHQDLPDTFPEDRLRTPHGAITDGTVADLACSDCHGAVGHGFDPVSGDIFCPMTVCLDCHQERGLAPELSDCQACHIGPHEPQPEAACSTCHQSTDSWEAMGTEEHPVELEGGHAQADCAGCHQDGDFGAAVSTECADCHEAPGGGHFGDACQNCHSPDGFGGARLPDHSPELEGNHESAPCTGCHAGGETAPSTVCSDCHQPPEEHLQGECSICHTPQGWSFSAGFLVSVTPKIPHGLDGQESCLACHDMDGGMIPAPKNHGDYVEAQCVLCHK